MGNICCTHFSLTPLQSEWSSLCQTFQFRIDSKPNDSNLEERINHSSHNNEANDPVFGQAIYKCQVNVVRIDEWELENLKIEQHNDTEIGVMYEWKQKNGDPPPWDELLSHSEAVRAYAHRWDRINLMDGLLYRSYADINKVHTGQQITVPAKLRGNFLKFAHEEMTNGHLSALKTKLQVRRRAYWNGWATTPLSTVLPCHGKTKQVTISSNFMLWYFLN